MRGGLIYFASLASLLIFARLSAGALPITQVYADPSPTTAPAAPTPVLLVPFANISKDGQYAWISQAIDEDLSHDMARNSAIRVVRPTSPQSPTSGGALDAARSANATDLVTGSYQIVDDQLRITGELVDVPQNKAIGQIKATGKVHDLFQLEDALSMQLWQLLPQPASQAQVNDIEVTPLDSVSNAPAEVYPEQTPEQTLAAAPEPANDQASYSGPGYSYPYAPYDSGYVYPYGWGYPLFIYGGAGYGHWGGGYHGGWGGNHGGHPVEHPSIGGGLIRSPIVSHGDAVGHIGGYNGGYIGSAGRR
jgi:TolB-like protein